MKVLLYRVSRNLNRVYRTAEAFGIEEILLLECRGTLQGNLFKAKERVILTEVNKFPLSETLALETFYRNSIYDVDWNKVSILVLGGETSGLPYTKKFVQMARIPMIGKVSGLTVEASLAIALYEWRKYHDTFTRT